MLTTWLCFGRSSIAESEGSEAESGFEEAAEGEAGAQVIRLVTRFVDKVCTEGRVSPEHIRSLHQMVPGVVHMHVEALDAVHRESKRLPPIQKVSLALQVRVNVKVVKLYTKYLSSLWTSLNCLFLKFH